MPITTSNSEKSFIDLHCHILPGVDDGPKDLETSLAILQHLAIIGFIEIHPTPHLGVQTWTPTFDEINIATKTLRNAWANTQIPLTICEPAAEIMWDAQFLEQWEKNAHPTYTDGKAFLVELPSGFLPAYLIERLFQFRLAGQLPVLAHVERYHDLMKNLNRVEELATKAALLVNITTLGGMGDRQTRKLARSLIDERLAHAVATDIHLIEDIPYVEKGIEWIHSELGENAVIQLLVKNPKRILAGEIPEW